MTITVLFDAMLNHGFPPLVQVVKARVTDLAAACAQHVTPEEAQCVASSEAAKQLEAHRQDHSQRWQVSWTAALLPCLQHARYALPWVYVSTGDILQPRMPIL